MRLISLTVHSSETVNIQMKDALTDNIDFIAQKIYLRKYGRILKEISKEGVYKIWVYEDKSRNYYSYGVSNESQQHLEIEVAFQEDQGLVSHVKNLKLRKMVPVKKLEFLMNLEASGAEHCPIPSVNYKFKKIN